ncbi:wax ester/triacylglycerol synthase family O-acyltransferase [Aeromicrobium sp. Leaf350]|uniref:WS/DGAT/MGAT family O-acyltransferase n=1 Tax=Aeromicrobium sp. Leaf350 TaxID=2876565 RepID=UPI001E58BB14|nr:wax ester/triacylglycerol synthase family O-acyltransferase [Aeromicrobium sp. Leaf350]
MPFMPPTDSMFLLAESREHPMHVGGLQLFEPPADAGPEYVRDLIEQFRSSDNVNPLFRKRPAEPVGAVGNTWWSLDETVDFDYHVRHSALPEPRRIRELLQATSHWHSSLLDRHRPLWECHVVEGLQDGRFAVYNKVHHSMIDGVSAIRLMQRSLSTDAEADDCLPPWLQPERTGGRPDGSGGGGFAPLSMARSFAGAAMGVAGDLAGLLPASARIAAEAIGSNDLTLPRAPRTMFNVPIGGARRFAAQSWEIERIRRVAKSSATTLNDVVLAMVSGALREYLVENNALPDEPMTAMVPVSLALRAGEDDGTGGNQVGVIIVNLATDRESGSTRLEEIAYSARQAKRILGDLTPTQILAFSALQMLPLAFTPVPGFVKYTHPPFNVIVSNVPGPTEEMYFNGARLDGMYPVSIALDGQAINITLTSRAGHIDVGIIGCRRTVPHLQRLLLHLESALSELEASWG